MHSLAKSAAVATIALTCVGGCRDWGRFESVESGAGGSGAGNAGGGSGTSMPSTTGTGTSTGTTSDTTTTTTSGPGGGGGGGDTDCGTLEILSDDFSGSELGWRWGHDTNYFAVQNGTLNLAFPPAPEEAGFQLESNAGFDFRGRTVVLEFSDPPPVDTDFWFDVAGDRTNYLEFVVWGGSTLAFTLEQDDNYLAIDEIAFDPAQHRFLRFREDGGVVYFDTSPDGTSWTEQQQYQVDMIFDPALTSIYVGGYTSGTNPMPVTSVAGITIAEPGTNTLCQSTMLKDDFDDGMRSWAWTKGWEGNCPIDETNGVLKITCGQYAGDSSSYGSTSAFDLTNSSVSVEIADPAEAGSESWLGLRIIRVDNDESFWSFESENGNLVLYEIVDGDWAQVGFQAYDPNSMRFLRIRESGGTVYFEISSDGQTFSNAYQRSAPFDVSQVRVMLAGGASNNASIIDVAFDNLNLGP